MTHLYEYTLERNGQQFELIVEWTFDRGEPMTYDHPGAGPYIDQMDVYCNGEAFKLTEGEEAALENNLMYLAYEMLVGDGFDSDYEYGDDFHG